MATDGQSETALPSLLNRLDAVTHRLEKVVGVSAGPAGMGEARDSEIVLQYESMLKEVLEPWVSISETVGGEVAEQAKQVKQAFQNQRDMLAVVASCKKPTQQGAVEKLIEPTSHTLAAVANIKDKARNSRLWNHLSAVNEGIQALGWICVDRSPVAFIAEVSQASEFYLNKVLLEFKLTDPLSVSWVQAFRELLNGLRIYVQTYHPVALTWNAIGGDVSKYIGGPAAVTSPQKTLAARPSGAMTDGSADPRASLFAQISGAGPNLRHVDRKNPPPPPPVPGSFNAPPPGSFGAPPPPAAAPAGPQSFIGRPRGPPRMELQGNKWVIENQQGGQFTVGETQLRQAVYIANCSGISVTIVGKVTNVSMEECKNCGVVFDSLVSSCELTNCQGCKIQATGKLPTLSVQKSDGTQAYLSRACLDEPSIEILTSKISEFNVLIPNPADPEDFNELPMPEQYRTTIRNGRLFTEAVRYG
eukprot:tig00000430_g654.t1